MRQLSIEAIQDDKNLGDRLILDVGVQMARVVRGVAFDGLRAAIHERFPRVDRYAGDQQDLQRGVRLAEVVIAHTKRLPEAYIQRQAGAQKRLAREALLELAADPELTSDVEVIVGDVVDRRAEKSWGTDRRGKHIGWRVGGFALDLPEHDGLLAEDYETTCRVLGRVAHPPFRSPLIPFALVPLDHPDPKATVEDVRDFVHSHMAGKRLVLGPMQYDSFPLPR